MTVKSREPTPDRGGPVDRPSEATALSAPDLVAYVQPVRLALGTARLTMAPWAPAREVAVATIHAGLDAGIRLIDSANCYSDTVADEGANERLVAEALATWPGDRDDVLVATKGGRWRAEDGTWQRDGRPESLRKACTASCRALGVERLGLYYLHIPDPSVPLEESVGALVELQREGTIAAFGISNVTAEELSRADGVGRAACVQNELSPLELANLDVAGQADRPFFAWSPLRGVRTDDEAGRLPAFSVAAQQAGLSVRQATLGWIRSLSPFTVPIIGPTLPTEVEEAVAAPDQLVDPALPRPGRRRACVITVRDDAVLMVEQLVAGRRFWTLPGGGIETGESDADAAARELLEETGLVAKDLQWLCDAPGPMFFATVAGDEEPRPVLDDVEVVGCAWRPLRDAAADWQVRVALAALNRFQPIEPRPR